MFKLPKELQSKYEPSFILSTDVKPSALEFAEDIVRRCAKVCEDVYGGRAHTYASENAETYRIQDQTIASCAKAIMHKFGLEKK